MRLIRCDKCKKEVKDSGHPPTYFHISLKVGSFPGTKHTWEWCTACCEASLITMTNRGDPKITDAETLLGEFVDLIAERVQDRLG